MLSPITEESAKLYNDNQLRPSRQEAIFKLVLDVGLAPIDFRWDYVQSPVYRQYGGEKPGVSAFIHEPTGSYFIFDVADLRNSSVSLGPMSAAPPENVKNISCEMKPGTQHEVETTKVESWGGQRAIAHVWLKIVKKEHDTPDVWRSWINEVESVTPPDFEQPKLLEDLPDRQFTPEEQNTIRGLVENFVETVETKHHDEMTEAQVRLLHAHADVAIEKAKDMKVRRWIFVLGTLYATWDHILGESPALKELSSKVVCFIQQVAQKLISENG